MATLIKAGGFYTIALIIFHLMFWRIFNWGTDLQALTFLNRAIMQVLNVSLIVVFFMFAYISFAHTHELLTTPLGSTLLVLISLFWLARTIQQIILFRLAHWVSWAFLLLFFTGSLLYGIPALHAMQIIP
jgi:hypothetical protein